MSWVSALAALPIALAIGGFVAPLIGLRVKNPRVFSIYLLLFSIASTIIVMGAALRYIHTVKPAVYPFGGWPPPLGITYEIDGLNALVGPIVCTVFLAAAIYCLWYFNQISGGADWLSALMLILMAGALGCIYTGDIFNFFVMLEVMCIASYALVAFFRKRRWAIEASASYAFIGALATTLFLLGAIYIYASFGTLNIADIASKELGMNLKPFTELSGSCSHGLCFGNAAVAISVAVALMLWALTFEAGIFPNNFWIPSAYSEAPSPASAMFSGIVDKVGMYGVLRLMFTLLPAGATAVSVTILGMPYRYLVLQVLAALGLVTGYLGAFLMAVQRDVKRLLAYSTISHIGLMFMTLAAATVPSIAALAVASIVYHMATHAFGEALLFMALGALATVYGTKRLDDLAGLGKRHPALMAAIVAGLISLLGMPPFGGFFSKYMMFLALIKSGFVGYAASIVIVSGISAIGYFRVIYTLALLKPRIAEARRVGVSTSVSCWILVAALLGLGALFISGALTPVLLHVVGFSATKKGVEVYALSAARVAASLIPR